MAVVGDFGSNIFTALEANKVSVYIDSASGEDTSDEEREHRRNDNTSTAPRRHFAMSCGPP